MILIRTVMMCIAVLMIHPNTALALQVHPQPEGLYAHQIAHAFFILSMTILAFWLQKSKLVEKKGWRYIQIGCVCFILWNINAMTGHIIDSKLSQDAFAGSGWTKKLVVEKVSAPYLYYLLKMDHLTCVPAMVFFFIGLRILKNEAEENRV